MPPNIQHNLRNWVKKKIHNLFYNWELIGIIVDRASHRAESDLYDDLATRIELDKLIAGLQKIRDEVPQEKKYIAVAELIRIQSDSMGDKVWAFDKEKSSNK